MSFYMDLFKANMYVMFDIIQNAEYKVQYLVEKAPYVKTQWLKLNTGYWYIVKHRWHVWYEDSNLLVAMVEMVGGLGEVLQNYDKFSCIIIICSAASLIFPTLFQSMYLGRTQTKH